MMICRGDTHPNLGLFDEFEATWCSRSLFRSGEAVEPAHQYVCEDITNSKLYDKLPI